MSRLKVTYQPVKHGRVIVWGYLAARPFGGMTWQVFHYLVGLRKLGFDVWYVEDSDIPVFSPSTWEPTWEYEETIRFVREQMESIGLGDRWVFRPTSVSDDCYGALDRSGLEQLYRESDAVLNICGSHKPRSDHGDIRCLVYVETDPVQSQIAVAHGNGGFIKYLSRYKYHFTYGENIGESDCTVPAGSFTWHKTRPPVCMEWWGQVNGETPGASLTTVANWNTAGKDAHWNGHTYRWRKDVQFEPYYGLPGRSELPLEMAIVGLSGDCRSRLTQEGWRLLPGTQLSHPMDYRRYIQESLGEFTVAKEQYVATNCGWFSDRSVCYLASGRPVVTQETGFSKFIPSGEGLFGFQNSDEAEDAIEAIAQDYPRHSRAARELAQEYFEAESVVGQMTAIIGLS